MTERRASLARRISQVTLASAAVTALVAALVSIPLVSKASETAARSSLSRYADIAADALNQIQIAGGGPHSGAPDMDGDDDHGQGVIGLPRLIDILRVQQIDAQRVPPGAQPLPPVRPGDLREVAKSGAYSTTHTNETGVYFVEGRLLSDRSMVFVTQESSIVLGVTTRAVLRFLAALLVGLMAALFIGLWAARRLARPLTSAAEAAHRLSMGERDVVLEPTGPTEVADIAEGLNRLSNALKVSEGRQREFLLTVSHELRTPLTSVKGYSEALADGVVPDDEIGRVGSLVKGEADRLDRLVADLLDLARLGAVDVAISPALVDLAALCRVAAEVWQDRCARAGVVFRLEVPDQEIVAFADALRVRQIIDNLCENALRVTPTGGPLVLAARIDAGGPVIEVRDGGPGLTADDMSVAFEPAELWNRYRGERKVGSGVGLALVAKLAERMSGRAEAGVAAEGGARFTVTLPAT